MAEFKLKKGDHTFAVRDMKLLQHLAREQLVVGDDGIFIEAERRWCIAQDLVLLRLYLPTWLSQEAEEPALEQLLALARESDSGLAVEDSPAETSLAGDLWGHLGDTAAHPAIEPTLTAAGPGMAPYETVSGPAQSLPSVSQLATVGDEGISPAVPAVVVADPEAEGETSQAPHEVSISTLITPPVAPAGVSGSSLGATSPKIPVKPRPATPGQSVAASSPSQTLSAQPAVSSPSRELNFKAMEGSRLSDRVKQAQAQSAAATGRLPGVQPWEESSTVERSRPSRDFSRPLNLTAPPDSQARAAAGARVGEAASGRRAAGSSGLEYEGRNGPARPIPVAEAAASQRSLLPWLVVMGSVMVLLSVQIFRKASESAQEDVARVSAQLTQESPAALVPEASPAPAPASSPAASSPSPASSARTPEALLRERVGPRLRLSATTNLDTAQDVLFGELLNLRVRVRDVHVDSDDGDRTKELRRLPVDVTVRLSKLTKAEREEQLALVGMVVGKYSGANRLDARNLNVIIQENPDVIPEILQSSGSIAAAFFRGERTQEVFLQSYNPVGIESLPASVTSEPSPLPPTVVTRPVKPSGPVRAREGSVTPTPTLDDE